MEPAAKLSVKFLSSPAYSISAYGETKEARYEAEVGLFLP